jgi:hypothetical protein
MKKEFRLLLFVTTLIGCSIISCEHRKNEHSQVSPENNLTPSGSVTRFFSNSLSGNESEINKLLTRTPPSFWVRCTPAATYNQNTINNDPDKETEKKWADDYFDLAKSTSKYIKTNNVKLLSINEERIFKDEAMVSVQTGNQFEIKNMTFYLTRESENWKIFLVNSDNSEPVKFKFAEERPACK